jgi:hypothetical protein
VSLDAREFGKPRPCRCGATLTVAWGRDPKTYKAVPVAMVQARGSVSAAKGPPVATAFCGCGYSAPVPSGEKNPSLRCPTCGKLMAVQNLSPTGTSKVYGGAKPSAPLLPLKLRTPLKTEVRRDAATFSCTCGMRILIRAGMEGSRVQCPECDEVHEIELENTAPPPPRKPQPRPSRPAPAAAPAPKPPEAALPPPPGAKPLGLGEFLCECGEVQPPRTSRTGREFVCKKCGRKGRVETDQDPQTGLPRMRPVYTSGPSAPASPAPAFQPPAPPPVPEDVVSFEELAPLEAPVVEGPLFGSTSADLPPDVDSDAQVVPCACGAEILLSASDVGHTIQCPACASTMVVRISTDARGKKITLQ